MKKGDLIWVWDLLIDKWVCGLLLTSKDKHEMFGVLMEERVMHVHNCYIELMTDDGKPPVNGWG